MTITDWNSTLAHADPELVGYFDAFAFGQTLTDAAALDASVDDRIRALVQMAAAIASGGLGVFRALASSAMSEAVVTPVEVKEVVYQAIAYVGMARAFDFLTALNEVLTTAGVSLPLEPRSASTPQTRREYGKSVQAKIIGGPEAVEQRLNQARADEAHFQIYLAENCFGDTVGRGGLDLPVRELVTFSMLASLGGADAQLRAHVRANLAVGNPRTRLLAVLTVLVPFIGYPRTLNAWAAINEVAPG